MPFLQPLFSKIHNLFTAAPVRNAILSYLYRGRWNGVFNLINQKSKTYLRFSLTILLHKIVGKRNTWEKFLERCLHNIGSGNSKNITTFRKIHKLFYFVELDGIRRRWTILHVIADEKSIFIMVLRNFSKKFWCQSDNALWVIHPDTAILFSLV